ncbi:MAG: hypothetical protein IKF50_03370 [Clostridia bacterium]|nr:hypothetical protein [Clostridia bacterium]
MKKKEHRKSENWFTRIMSGVWGRLRKNFALRILSLVFAFILWGYVLATTNPQRDKTISNLPLQVSNQQLLEDRGIALVEDIANTVSARVVVRASNERLADVTSANVNVYVDLSPITDRGTYTLDLQASTQYGSVQKISPSSITVTVERRVSKIVSIAAELPNAEEETWRSEYELYPAQVTVSGAVTVLEEIEDAFVQLPSEDANENVVRALPIRFRNSGGQEIDPNVASEINSAVLTVHYYPTARIPIKLNSVITAAPGYEITEIEMLRQTAIVAAPREDLAGIREVATELLEAKELSETQTLETKLILPEGAANVEPDYVRVKVTVRENTSSVTMENVNVFAVLGDDFENDQVAANVNIAPVNVVLTGPRNLSLNRSDLRLYVDVTNAKDGDALPLMLYWTGSGQMPQGLTISSPQTVTVNIEQ